MLPFNQSPMTSEFWVKSCFICKILVNLLLHFYDKFTYYVLKALFNKKVIEKWIEIFSCCKKKYGMWFACAFCRYVDCIARTTWYFNHSIEERTKIRQSNINSLTLKCVLKYKSFDYCSCNDSNLWIAFNHFLLLLLILLYWVKINQRIFNPLSCSVTKINNAMRFILYGNYFFLGPFLFGVNRQWLFETEGEKNLFLSNVCY